MQLILPSDLQSKKYGTQNVEVLVNSELFSWRHLMLFLQLNVRETTLSSSEGLNHELFSLHSDKPIY